MRHLKKLFAATMVLAMSLALFAVPAYAASITINRDSSWDENAENAEATYTYYKIFDAADVDQSVIESTGAQATQDGVAVYTISGSDAAAKVAKLPNIFLVNGKSPSQASAAADGKYYITLASNTTTAEDIASALKTMVDANTTLFPGVSVTSDENPVEIEGLDSAYYLIVASNGSVLAVQTLDDVTINEKNDYPTVDKKQGEAADTITYAGDDVTVQVGDYIYYQVTVHIPTNANKDIIVGDKMSAGLAYDSQTGLTYNPNISSSIAEVATTDVGYDANATWQIKIPADTVIANKGNDVVITYRAQVTSAALTDAGKNNKVTLTYDNGNYVLTDETKYKVYFGGIYKVDPNDAQADMSGVKFALADGDGNAVNVTYVTDGGYYVVDASSTSNEVETRKDGDYYTIKIRGLDGDKVYALTETAAKNGYNLLNGTVTLTKTEDKGSAFADKAANTFDKVENNKGSVLPSTGGMGTTILYIVGGIMVLLAVVFLIAKKRAAANKDDSSDDVL